MADMILGERFASRELAAWHPKGQTVHGDHTAVELLEMTGSDYAVELVPIEAEYQGIMLGLKERAIVRGPLAEDPNPKVFGIAGPQHTILNPRQVAEVWDLAVSEPTETFGVLYSGEVLFITTRLPAIDVKGDEVEMYMALVNYMDGTRATRVDKVPIRIVCHNTLTMAMRSSLETLRVVHDRNIEANLRTWLAEMYGIAVLEVKLVQEAFTALADTKVKGEDLTHVMEIAYPYPTKPRRNAPDDVMKKRIERWDYQVVRTDRFRGAAEDLFLGKGTGMDHVSTKGTAYGLFNAIAETEDYRNTLPQTDLNDLTADILMGRRAEIKRRAFVACAELAGVTTN